MATRQSELIITCNAKGVQSVMNILDQRLQAIKKRMQEINDIGEKGGMNKALEKEFKQLQKEATGINNMTIKAKDSMKKYSEVIKDLSGAKLKDLKKALQEGKAALNNMSARDPGRQKLIDDLRKIQAQIDTNTGAIKKQQSAWGSLGTTLKNLVAYMGVFAGFNKLKQGMESIISLNKEFSDQMANVRKVSNLSMQEIGKLADNLSKIDSRTSLKGLMDLSYTAAKLGFGEYGIGGLESFAKSAVKVQNALGEDMGEDAMTALSKMVEVMGLIPKMGVERAMDATGSAIFKLASTSTATGTNIVEFTKRLMGMANVSHVTTAELLALGSASDSMGLMAEVSSTAFNKVFTSIQSNTAEIEKAVGITEGSLKSLINQGRTMDAIVTVFDKMHDMSMEEMKARGIFKALGSDGARMNNVITTMSNKIDMLRSHLLVSTEAFDEATAVAKEYEIQMDTAAAYSERAANMWEKAFVNPEGVDVVKELSKAWYDVTKSMTESEKVMLSMKMSIQAIIFLIKALVTFLPEIGFSALIGGMAMMITKLRETEGLLKSITIWWGRATLAQKAFFKAAGWAGIILAAYEFGKYIYDIAINTKQASEYMKGFKEDVADVKKEHYEAQRQLDGYVAAIRGAAKGTNEHKAAINNFNKIYKPYLSNLLTEKSTAADVARAYEEVNKQLRAKIALQAKEKDIETQVNPRVRWEADKLEDYDATVSGTNRAQYNATWLKGVVDDAHAAGKSVHSVALALAKQMNLTEGVAEKVWQLRGYNISNMPAKMKNEGMGNFISRNPKSEQAQLLNAINYTLQAYSTRNAMGRVDKKYKPWQKDIENMLAQNEDEVKTYEGSDTTGGGGSLTTKIPPSLKEAKDDAEKNAKAVIGSIEEFFRLQEAAANEMAANGQLKDDDFNMFVKHIQDRKDKVLLEARRAITGDPNEFESIRQTLQKDIVKRDDKVSQAAMQRIQEANPAKEGATLRKFDGSDAVYGLDSNAFLNNIRKNAAQNELNIQRRQADVAKEIDKMLLQYQFVEQAQRKFGDKLVKLGLITDGYDKVVQQLADGTEVVANTKDVQALATKVVGNTRQLYSTDRNDEAQLNALIDSILKKSDGGDESFAGIFKDREKWTKEQMQAFYQVLIDLDKGYYDALRQNYNTNKKEQEERWERSGIGQYFTDLDRQLSDHNRELMMTGANQGTNFAQMGGFTTLDEDPELAMYFSKMEASKMWLEQLRQEQADERLIREAEQQQAEAEIVLQEQIMSKINDRISKLQEWTDPIEQFGAEVGEAMGKAVSETESMAEGMKNALKNMSQAWGQSTIDIVKQLMLQKLRQKMINKAMKKETKESQQEQTEITKEGGAARLAAEQGMAVVTQQASNLLVSTK